MHRLSNLQLTAVTLLLLVMYQCFRVFRGSRQKPTTAEAVEKKPVKATATDLKQQFPACFPVPVDLSLAELKFVPHNENRAVTYNHTCFLMKARYNCAHNNTNEPHAEDFKLMYRLNGREEFCDLNEVVNWIGGPTGLATFLRPLSRPYQVAMQGDSRLRQVFEALVCRFSHQITDIKLSLNGPSMSMSAVETLKKERNAASYHNILRFDELPTILHVDMEQIQKKEQHTDNLSSNAISFSELERGGCHSVGNLTNLTSFYNVGPVPRNIAGCTDDFAMVEFGGAIRFYYSFRSFWWDDDAVYSMYTHLGMPVPENGKLHVDTLVWNMGGGRVGSKGCSEFPHAVVPPRGIDWRDVHPYLNQIQAKGGIYFGAKNPMIKDGVDPVHNCLPGPPDDNANLLLLRLMDWAQ